MSCLSERFHKAIHYGKKIKNSDKYSLTLAKISDSNRSVSDEHRLWELLPQEERAYEMYHLMLDKNDKSGLKAIVAQCLASLLRWDISDVHDDLTEEQMFDLDLYQCLVDDTKRQRLKEEIENDEYIRYLVNAIKYAVGEKI